MGAHREEGKRKKHNDMIKTLNINLYKHAFKITEKMLSPKTLVYVSNVHGTMTNQERKESKKI